MTIARVAIYLKSAILNFIFYRYLPNFILFIYLWQFISTDSGLINVFFVYWRHVLCTFVYKFLCLFLIRLCTRGRVVARVLSHFIVFPLGRIFYMLLLYVCVWSECCVSYENINFVLHFVIYCKSSLN